MAHTAAHRAIVILVNDSEGVAFEITKIKNDLEMYRCTVRYGRDCYDAAMDMVRDNGRSVSISINAARAMEGWACSIDHEWNVITSLKDMASAENIRYTLG